MVDFVKYGIEFLGTFLFLSVILTTANPIAITIALLAMIYFGGNISGGHFNPAVTTMFLAKGDIEPLDALMYISSQVLGGICAYLFYSKVVKNYKK
jgi:aquaporin Z